MSVEGHQATDGEDMQAFMNALSPGYFETMQIPMLEGRDFSRSDVEGERDGRDRQPPASPSTSSRARARSASTSAAAAGPTTKLDDRDHRRRRRLAVRRAARRRAAAGVRAELGHGQRGVLRAHARRLVAAAFSADPQRGEAARRRRCRSTTMKTSRGSSTRRC